MDGMKKARNTAAGYLANKPYTCQELLDRLRRKGYEEDICTAVIEELCVAGYLDDRQYASLYVEDAIRLGAKGKFRIRQELLRKGVAPSVIDEALNSTDLSTEACLSEYIRLHHLCDHINSYKDLEKVKARLARRGYSLSEIRHCLEKYTFRFDD